MSYYSLSPSDLQSLQFLFIIQLFFCGISTCPRPLAEYSVISRGMSVLNYPNSKKKRICSPEYYRQRHQQLEKGIVLYAIVATGTGESYSYQIQEVPLSRAMMKLERNVLDVLPVYMSYISRPVVSPFQSLLSHSPEEGFARP